MVSSSQATGCSQPLLATRLLSQAATSTSGKCDVPEGHQNSDLSPTACHIGLNRRRDLSLRQDLCLFRPDGKATLKDIFKVRWVQQASAAGSLNSSGLLSAKEGKQITALCQSSSPVRHASFAGCVHVEMWFGLTCGPWAWASQEGHCALRQLGLYILQCLLECDAYDDAVSVCLLTQLTSQPNWCAAEPGCWRLWRARHGQSLRREACPQLH